MKRLQLSMQTVKAIFISHEHSDHIQGVSVLAKKYKLPVYITATTLYSCGALALEKSLLSSFSSHQPVQVGSLHITAFPKLHDAAEPHSFIITNEEVTVGVFTDIGAPCKHVIQYFKQCHAAFLEANYDEVMLEKGRYPHHLKKRIRGGHGHLSNRQALELFTTHKPPFMSHLLLSHLSEENNHPQLVQKLFNAQANGTNIIVASRFQETEVYEISHTLLALPTTRKQSRTPTYPAQLSLF
jgi:phosphoribosyl 1,2-cyclic phosphodiesterase